MSTIKALLSDKIRRSSWLGNQTKMRLKHDHVKYAHVLTRALKPLKLYNFFCKLIRLFARDQKTSKHYGPNMYVEKNLKAFLRWLESEGHLRRKKKMKQKYKLNLEASDGLKILYSPWCQSCKSGS